jgi:DNA-binding MarR family transcriptional regulator/N-acetylglutamate synthase-like GNAT family acetyltransferase
VPVAPAAIADVRRFNRTWTKLIGALDEGLANTPHSLPEARLLYEVANRDGPSAGLLAEELRLDAGYLSRLLRTLADQGLVTSRRADDDARRMVVRLTAKGTRAFARLNAEQDRAVEALLAPLGDDGAQRIVQAMHTIEQLVAPSAPDAQARTLVPFVLRPHRTGDMGWVVWRHGVLYAREYGWSERFESLVARIVADFVDQFDAQRERCWIAERDGENVGSIFLKQKSREVAQLRLLLVEPSARGLGVGKALVHECVRTARALGYRTMTLWTNASLVAARGIYQSCGFQLVEEQPHELFGVPSVGQTWELDLTSSNAPV